MLKNKEVTTIVKKVVSSVDEFHTKFELEGILGTEIKTSDESREVLKALVLRHGLLSEELGETLKDFAGGNKEKVLDGIVDMMYITGGTLALLGTNTDYYLKSDDSPVVKPETPESVFSIFGVIQGVAGCLVGGRAFVGSRILIQREELAIQLYKTLVGLIITAHDHLGVDIEKAFDEVHNSNMTKLGEDGKPIYNESGKIMKGPNFKEPNLKEFDYDMEKLLNGTAIV